jgi:hypothetical protein
LDPDFAAVVTAIQSAYWNINYHNFLARVGATDDDYWREKWSQWGDLNASLANFDVRTLERICTKTP